MKQLKMEIMKITECHELEYDMWPAHAALNHLEEAEKATKTKMWYALAINDSFVGYANEDLKFVRFEAGYPIIEYWDLINMEKVLMNMVDTEVSYEQF